MEHGNKEPVYPIGVVTKLLKVCQATLRIWERKGLIKPERLGKNRFYSKFDLDRLERIKYLIQKKRINIEGVKNILQSSKCWEVRNCSLQERKGCPMYARYAAVE